MLQALTMKMIAYDAPSAHRIQHFMKVHAFARTIAIAENMDAQARQTLEAAALVHDIGIKLCEEKYGSGDGKLQEKEGPALAAAMLGELGFDAALIDRVCFLVAHHHTYDCIDGADYQILVEADFLVNLHEGNASREKAQFVLNTIFKTETGKTICREMFGLA